jgi:hypothetical protein
MVVTPLPVTAPPAPIAAVPAAPAETLFTGLLQQLLTDMAPPPPAPPAAPVPVEQKEPVRIPGRADREPPAKSEDARQIDATAVGPVSVPVPPPPLLTPPPAPGPVEKKSDPLAPLVGEHASAPAPAPEAAVIVAVRNTEVLVVKAPDVKEVVEPERHVEIPEASAPAETAEAVVVARPPIKVEALKPVAMPDQAMPEKRPVRALAIEFRPDGVHDIRVRLAEHGGEVHVSVHSADPVVTQDLRDGVTSLALTLTQAGYDARAWTPDQGQRQQQPREERAAKREKRAADTKFDGALEEVSR